MAYFSDSRMFRQCSAVVSFLDRTARFSSSNRTNNPCVACSSISGPTPQLKLCAIPEDMNHPLTRRWCVLRISLMPLCNGFCARSLAQTSIFLSRQSPFHFLLFCHSYPTQVYVVLSMRPLERSFSVVHCFCFLLTPRLRFSETASSSASPFLRTCGKGFQSSGPWRITFHRLQFILKICLKVF